MYLFLSHLQMFTLKNYLRIFNKPDRETTEKEKKFEEREGNPSYSVLSG